MRLSILITAGVLCCAAVANADYDYVIEEGYTSLTLYDYETLLMIGGGGHSFDFFDYSQATIEGTSPLSEFDGGIWMLLQAGYSSLDFSGGEVHQFDIGSYATATFSGGRIDEIWSYQTAWTYAGDPLELVPDPHIEIVCLDWDWNESTNLLTGTWADLSAFNIQLVDRTQYGYDPAIENISFTIVPEPASLLLIAAGGLLLRRRS